MWQGIRGPGQGAGRLHSGRAGSPMAPPACPLAARGGGGRDAALAAMGAVGIRLGSVDASIPRALPGAARPLGAEGAEAWAAMGRTTHSSRVFRSTRMAGRGAKIAHISQLFGFDKGYVGLCNDLWSLEQRLSSNKLLHIVN